MRTVCTGSYAPATHFTLQVLFFQTFPSPEGRVYDKNFEVKVFVQRWHILPLNFQIVCFRFFFPATTQSNRKSSICGLQIVAWDQAPIGGKRREKVGVGEFKKRTER